MTIELMIIHFFSHQMEHLYMDVLYTIKYKVGADTELSAHRDQLYVYAQKAFDVTPEQHRRYMAIVHEEKVSFFNFSVIHLSIRILFAVKFIQLEQIFISTF
jgi:hypothetical protein